MAKLPIGKKKNPKAIPGTGIVPPVPVTAATPTPPQSPELTAGLNEAAATANNTTAQREEAGNAFIRARETRANELIKQGISQPRAVELASIEIASMQQKESMAATPQVAPPTPEQLQAANQLGNLTPEQQNLNVVQGDGELGTAGAVAGGLAGIAAGTVAGAALGSIVPGVGTVAGSVIGGVLGATGGTFTKISLSKREDVKQAYTVYTTSKSNIGWIINQVNQGKMSPTDAQIMYDEELANFYSAERNIKKDTSTNLKRFLSGGADEAAKIESFKRRLPYLQLQLQQSIMQPNPAAASVNLSDPREE